MAVRVVPVVQVVKPEIVDPLQRILAQLELDHGGHRVVTICPTENHFNRKDRFANFRYNEETTRLASGILKDLQHIAATGGSKGVISFEKDLQKDHNSIAHVCVVFDFLQKRVGLKIEFEQPWDHGPFCRIYEAQMSFPVSWEQNNTYLDPKPMLSFPPSPPWGVQLLNNKRKAGEGDCEVKFGEHRFNVHLDIFKTFCPVFDAMASRGMKESTEKKFSFSHPGFRYRDQLEAFVSYMYTQQIDLGSFLRREVIALLDWSFELQSEALRDVAFKEIYDRGPLLDSLALLSLLYTNTKHKFAPLQTFCDWFLRIKPRFYESILKVEELSSEDLLLLFNISRHYQLKELQKELDVFWSEMTIPMKISFVRASLEKVHPSLLEGMESLCTETFKTLKSDDKDRPAFIAAYDALRRRVFDVVTAVG